MRTLHSLRSSLIRLRSCVRRSWTLYPLVKMSTEAMMYDVAVIGAGIIGSSTAYHLVHNGVKRVLLLEQFPLPHTRGSSHGGSRITRRAYTQPYYVEMMEEAFRIWDQIQEDSNMDFYIKTGILVFGEEGNANVQNVISSLKSNNVSYEELSGEEVNRRYPDQLKLPSSYTCVLEQDGGILSCQKAIEALQQLFVRGGGLLLDQCPVKDVIPGEDVIELITSKTSYLARKVVITVGPWAQTWMNKLNLGITLKVNRSEVYYWKPDHPEHFESAHFPVFIHYFGETRSIYSIPIHEYPGMIKVAIGGPLIEDPDDRDAHPICTKEYRDVVSDFIGKHLKSVSTQCSIYEACLCTWTCDSNPILDYHPKHRNIIIGVGMSGHGFKLSPVIGKMLYELALDIKPSYDLAPFRCSRSLHNTHDLLLQ